MLAYLAAGAVGWGTAPYGIIVGQTTGAWPGAGAGQAIGACMGIAGGMGIMAGPG